MSELEAGMTKEICLGNNGRYKGELAAREWLETRFSTKKMLDFDAIKGEQPMPSKQLLLGTASKMYGER